MNKDPDDMKSAAELAKEKALYSGSKAKAKAKAKAKTKPSAITKEKARQKKMAATDPDDMKTPEELAREAASFIQPAPQPKAKAKSKAKAKARTKSAIDKERERQRNKREDEAPLTALTEVALPQPKKRRVVAGKTMRIQTTLEMF